ncbi:MAG: TonB-dependent receptor [Pseudomonadota bacterium]
MNQFHSRAPLAAITLAMLAPVASHAQASSPTLAPVVVTATRTPQALADVVADITLIDRDAIERSGAINIADLLAREPGIAFTRNGGPGASTNLSLRGGDTRFTALFIDGVRVDSQTGGGATWQAIPLSHVDRIEVLRGPAGAVYGSDAIAGVVQIFTRRGEVGFHPAITLGAGTQGQRKADVSLRGGSGALDYSLGVAREISQGFNAQPAANPDRDGYRKSSATASVGLQISPAHRLEGTALWSDLDAQYDAPTPRRDDHSIQTLSTAGLAWAATWSQAFRTRWSMSQGKDRYETLPTPYLAQTRIASYLLQNEWHRGAHRFTLDAERREDRLDNSSTTPALTQRSQDGLAVGYGFSQDAHTLQLNARHDQDSEFGGRSTGSAAYAYALATGWRVTASAGTAFRAPTLFQRFSIYGVASLRPESSHNRELGIKYAGAGRSFSLIAYRNDVTDLIAFVSGSGTCANGGGASPGCYGNVGRARMSGFTLAAEQDLGAVRVRGSLDLLDPKNLDTGHMLARRPDRTARLSAETRVQGWRIGAETQLVAHAYNNATSTQRLAGYGLVNLYATGRIARDWTLIARIDNLADRAYETTRGYASPGRSAQVALQWQPR